MTYYYTLFFLNIKETMQVSLNHFLIAQFNL